MGLIGKQRNMWDIDLTKLFHLTDPEWYTPERFQWDQDESVVGVIASHVLHWVTTDWEMTSDPN